MLKLIVVTHGDADHVGNCRYLRDKFGARIAMHGDEVEAVTSGNPALNKKIPRSFSGLITTLLLRFFKLRASDRFQPDMILDDGDDLKTYGFDAKVLHLPGHSNGSVGILTADGALFCGDLLRNRRRPAAGFGIFDRAGFDASIKKLEGLAVTTVYPGHGKPFALQTFLQRRQV
jgi:glyoxylase-like metal-dependent hydrolase (beta-lactamase superfamily II)